MTRPGKLLRNLWVSAWYTIAIAIVLLATTFSAIRLLLPYTSQYGDELSAEISQQLGQPVKVEALEAEWRGWNPALVLSNISLLDENTGATLFQLSRVRLGLDLLRSLTSMQPVFSQITLIGVDLQLTRGRDQRIAISGLESTGEGETNLDNLAAWVFSQGWIRLENSNFTWRDLTGQGRLLKFSSVNISLRNAGKRHLLDASVMLPGNQGDSLNLHVDMRGDLLNAEGRETTAYLEGKQLRLKELLKEQSIGNLLVSAEQADFRVWGEWQAGQLRRLQGNVSAGGVSLVRQSEDKRAGAEKQEPVQLPHMASRFDWQHMEGGWQLDADDLVVTPAGAASRPARVSLHYLAGQEQAARVKLKIGHLQLDSFAGFVGLVNSAENKAVDMLTALAPRGDVYRGELEWSDGESPNYRLYAQLQDAAVNAWQNIPAANDVDGEFWLSNNRGQVVLEHAALEVDNPRLFRGPIPVDSLQGELAWELNGAQWRLGGRNLQVSNEDIRAHVSLDMVGDKSRRRPFVSIFAEFQDGDGSQLSRYLPAGIMRPKAVKWLDEGIISGKVVSGDVVIHGDLRHFPFAKGNGSFEVNAKVENGRLNYANDWPVIQDIDADVQFKGRGMSVNARDGRIFSNRIQQGFVHIADLKKKPLLVQVRGVASGSTQEKLDYLLASPVLSKTFGRHAEKMQAEGDSVLHLNLDFPIGKKAGAILKGRLMVKDNSLSIEPIGKVLNEIEGELKFTGDSLSAESIRARLLGQPSLLTVSTEETAQNRNIYFRIHGGYDAQSLVSHTFPSLKDYFSGAGRWDISLMIPLRTENTVPNTATLRAVTDLQGVTVTLPPPLNKSANATRNLVLNVGFPGDQASVLRLGIDDVLDSVIELPTDQVDGLARGEIRFRQGPATLPKEQDIRVYGRLEEFSLDDWRDVWEKQSQGSVGQSSLAPQFNLMAIKDVRIQADKLTAFGMPFHALQLQLGISRNYWDLTLDSQEIKGRIQVPKDIRRFPIEAKLAHWYLSKPETGEAKLDPRDIPAMKITAQDFRYKDRRFGKLTLKATRQPQGLRLDQLQVEPESTSISLHGGWYVRGNAQHSNVNLKLESENIENTLTSLGYVGAINKGKGTLTVGLKWPSSLLDVDLAKMQGQVNMDLSDGSLLDIDPGAGRIFGLLSLQMLPKRLALDFSDVFKKGFGFNRITGNFNIANGHAHTEDFLLEGPSARVDIVGRVGLVDEDYDQIITVTPQVSDALPLLGALAVTPQVGAAILFAQKVLKLKLDKVTQIRYSIKGPWSQPVIETLKKPSP